MILDLEYLSQSQNRFKSLRLLLLNLKFFLKGLNSDFLQRNLKRSFWRYPSEHRGFLLSPHEYFGLKFGLFRTLELKIRILRIELRKVQQRYVGVGYKDKGSSRKVSLDGSPPWGEVCSDYRIRKKLDRTIYSFDDPPEIYGGIF